MLEIYLNCSMCGSSGPLFRMCSALKPVCRPNIWLSSSRCWENWEKPVDRWLRNLVCSRIRMPKLRKVRPMYSAEHVAQISRYTPDLLRIFILSLLLIKFILRVFVFLNETLK